MQNLFEFYTPVTKIGRDCASAASFLQSFQRLLQSCCTTFNETKSSQVPTVMEYVCCIFFIFWGWFFFTKWPIFIILWMIHSKEWSYIIYFLEFKTCLALIDILLNDICPLSFSYICLIPYFTLAIFSHFHLSWFSSLSDSSKRFQLKFSQIFVQENALRCSVHFHQF